MPSSDRGVNEYRDDRGRRRSRCRLWPVLMAIICCTGFGVRAQPLPGGILGDVFSSGSGGSRGRTTYPTGSQAKQPNDGPCNNPYGCGRGGALSGGVGGFNGGAGGAPYPQGRDVYCQQSPGQPMYGPYHGTGTQTPCGPNFQRMPTRPPPPQQAATTSCSNTLGQLDPADRRGSPILPVRLLSLATDGTAYADRAAYVIPFGTEGTARSAFVQRVQSKQTSGGLMIGGKKINPNSDKDYNCTIKFLTVPDNSQSGTLFASNDTASIKAKLEDPLRRQIFDAMAGNSIPFRFKTTDTANENIDIRVETIRFMRSIQYGYGSCRFTSGQPYIVSTLWTRALPPAGWQAPGGLVLDSATSPEAAHPSIIEFTNALISFVDCLGGVELTIFVGVDRVIGRDRFNAEHSEGLQNIGLNVPVTPPTDTSDDDEPTSIGAWNGISIFKNVKVFSMPTFEMMVPGDWVYMRNDPRYRGGPWTGENTIYMGKYAKLTTRNDAIYLRPSDQGYDGQFYARFSGLGGETDRTAATLRDELRDAFNAKARADKTNLQADTNKIGWTVLGRIKAGDNARSSTSPRPPPAALSGAAQGDMLGNVIRNLFGQ